MIGWMLTLLVPVASVAGTVRAEGSREPIPYAMVQVVPGGRAVQSDARGYYVLTSVPAGALRLRATAPGYRPAERVLDVPGSGDVRVDFELASAPVLLAGVQARAAAARAAAVAGPGPARLDATLIKTLPAAIEPDVLRAVQSLPSVAAASDFSSALYVRGGAPDQNLLLLDGVPLFNPYHLGGAFAAIDPDAVTAVEMYPGAYPASLGGRLSSVLQVWTREGGRDRVRATGSVGLLSARAGVDGPLPGVRGSYALSARRTYLDLVTAAAARLGLLDSAIPYGFSDGHAKLTLDVGARGRLSGAFYINRERLEQEDDLGGKPDRFGWGSRAASVSYRQPIGNRLLLDVLGGYTDFGSATKLLDRVGSEQRPVVNADLRMRDYIQRASLTAYMGPHRLETGVEANTYRFSYDVTRQEGRYFSDLFPETLRATRATTYEAYLEDQWKLSGVFSVRGGLRAMDAGPLGRALLPRFGARAEVTPRLALTLGGGRYAQALHSLRDDESVAANVLAYDLLSAPSPALGLETSRDLAFGAEWRGDALLARVDVYTKRLDNLVLPPLPANPFDAPVLVTEGFTAAKGSARGLELMLERAFAWGDLRGSYVLAAASR